jgi:glucose 1-dehydrogenase/sorbitol-6-phosphate 2-dehydrogenase
MDLHLQNQSVVIFGAASGIGKAIANSFAHEGCIVHAADISAGDGIHPCDVTDLDSVETWAQGLNRVDHVVFSVGAGSGKFGFPFWNLHPSDWQRVLNINLIGAVNVAHAFGPRLIQRGSGSLLFLVSVAGQIGSQTDPPYTAAKAALISFTKCAAKDFAPHGVRVNAIAPGMVQTPLNQRIWKAGQSLLPESEQQDFETWGREKLRKLAPIPEWQTPEEIGAMAAYLASPHARHITGQTLNIDGGQVMHS